MSQQAAPRISTQELLSKHRKRYFFMQMRTLVVSTTIMVAVAQFFLMHQLAAIIIAAISIDIFRMGNGTRLYWLVYRTWNDEEVKDLRQYFWSSTPRRWLEYALLALPANALVTYGLHPTEFEGMDNIGTVFFDYAQSVVGLVIEETSKLKSGAATLTVDFGIVGVLEYIAMRYVFAKRKLKKSKKT